MSFVKHKQISVFISSAIRDGELEYDRQIAEQTLKDMNLIPSLFEVFPAMSYSTSQSCREEAGSCDIFLMLLWKSFRPNVKEELAEAVKRNKPILILVKSLIDNEKREDDLESFINGLQSDSPEHSPLRLTYKPYRKVDELRAAVRDSVAAEIAKFYKEPIYTMARDEMYELGTFIIQHARRRLYLFQRTPSLILGARNYLDDDAQKYTYEKEFKDVLTVWIQHNYNLLDKEFLYLFSCVDTQQEIKAEKLNKNANYLSDVKKQVQWLKKIEEISGHRFRINMLDVPVSGPLIVGDNRYAIWILGKDQAISVSQENKGICDFLARMLNSYSQEHMNIQHILSALGL